MSQCDGCGKERRPYQYARDGEYEHGMMFCFLCVKEDERRADKAEREELARMAEEDRR